MNPGFHDMTDAEYHSDPCPQPSLSASIAKVLIGKSPLHAWYAHPKLNPDYEPERHSAFDIGTAAHEALLLGMDRVHVIHAKDWRKAETQAERDEARAAGKIPILAGQYRNLSDMLTVAQIAIKQCPDLSGMTLADGRAEQAMVWREGPTWCRSKMDWIANDHSLIIDYKTTSGSAEPNDWTRTSLVTNGNDLQAAFYRRGVKAITGKSAAFVFLVQEIKPPFACSFIGMPPAFLALGEAKLADALDTWARCMKSGHWPGYSPRICWAEPPAWAEMRYQEKSSNAAFDALQHAEGLQA
jgi:hypothetical protein